MDIEKKEFPTSNASIQGQLDELIKFLEYEEAITVDPTTQRRIRKILEKMGIWTSD